MTEPSRTLFYLPIIYLWTGGVEGDVLASLAPPVHLSGERLGWTLLVCMVSDLKRGHLEVSWRSPSDRLINSSPYSIAVDRKHRGHGAVAIITVATNDWPSYSCSVSHRRHPKVIRRHHTTSSDHQDRICKEYEATKDADVWTNTVVVLNLRLLLMKIIACNTLMTIYVVIKWVKTQFDLAEYVVSKILIHLMFQMFGIEGILIHHETLKTKLSQRGKFISHRSHSEDVCTGRSYIAPPCGVVECGS